MTNFSALDTAKGELNGLRADMKKFFEEAGPSMDMAQVKSFGAGDKLAWIREQKAQVEKATAKVLQLQEVAGIAEENAKHFIETGDMSHLKEVGGQHNGILDVSGMGGHFVKSAAYTGYTRGSGQGPVAEIPVNVKTLFQRSAGWAPESTRSGVVVPYATRPAPFVVDYIPNAPVSQAAYKYMEETTFTNNAAERAEGAVYAESALALTERSKTVESVGTWMPVTDEQLEDVDGAQAYIDNRLQLMLAQRVDSQVLVGDGSTPNILGTENVAGIQTLALGGLTVMDAAYTMFTTIRSTAFAEPSVVFINPSKWSSVVMLKDSTGQYIWGHPSASVAHQTLWGVPVVATTAHTSTKMIIGDYATHSLLGIRRGLEMQVTNSHDTFFINGKQAIRASLRLVMVHFRPAAFGVVTGL